MREHTSIGSNPHKETSMRRSCAHNYHEFFEEERKMKKTILSAVLICAFCILV